MDSSAISVRDAMTRKPVVVSPQTSIKECAIKMIEGRVGSLLVQENNFLKGMITEKDIVERVVIKGHDSNSTFVSDVMTKIIITILPEKDIVEAMRLMNKNNIRRLPVIDEKDNLIGLLTVNDVLKIQPQLFDLALEKMWVNKPCAVGSGDLCSICGNYTSVKPDFDGNLVCSDCVESKD